MKTYEILIPNGDSKIYAVNNDCELMDVLYLDFANYMIEAFDEYIDDNIPLVDVLGFKYRPSRVLKEVDQIAYDCAYGDWLDYISSEIFNDMMIDDSLQFGRLVVFLNEDDE